MTFSTEASGLSLRRFAAITGVQASRRIIEAAKPDTVARWLAALDAEGIDLECTTTIHIRPDGVTWRSSVTRVDSPATYVVTPEDVAAGRATTAADITRA